MLQMKTPSRSVLVAMTVCPTTTPNNDAMQMTSMARSRVAGVLASTSALRRFGPAFVGAESL